MVGTSPPLGLCSSETQWCRSVDMKTAKTTADLRHSARPQGLDVRELSSFQRRQKCFLLTSPFIEPAQAAVLGLLRPGAGDAQQRRLWLRQRATGAPQKAGVHSGLELEPQPRSEKPV